MLREKMQIKVDDVVVLELNETEQRVFLNDIFDNAFEDDIRRRVAYIVKYKYQACLKRLRDEWIPKLAERGVKSIPLDPNEFAELVFSQVEYKSRSQRESSVDITESPSPSSGGI